MTNRTTYRVTAERSGGWWALEAPEIRGCHSQARRLDQADEMIRDAISLMLDVPPDSFDVDLVVELEAAAQTALDDAKRMLDVALEARRDAAAANRHAAAVLAEAGLSMRDVGRLMGVSFQRAAQLAVGDRVRAKQQIVADLADGRREVIASMGDGGTVGVVFDQHELDSGVAAEVAGVQFDGRDHSDLVFEHQVGVDDAS